MRDWLIIRTTELSHRIAGASYRSNVGGGLQLHTMRSVGAHARSEWIPVSRPAAVAWMLFYIAFLVYALGRHGSFLFIDLANLVVHEGGHLLFGWFGEALGIWGGTLLQWGVPLSLAGYFYAERHTVGFTFCAFFFFENLLYTATYMCDARAMILPLVTAGGSDYIEHDWHTIFSRLGVLQYDTWIGGLVRAAGWCGMVTVILWFCRITCFERHELQRSPAGGRET